MQQYPGPFPKKKWNRQSRDQLKKLKKKDIVELLKKDSRWKFVGTDGARFSFYNPIHRQPWDYVVVHYHDEEYRNFSLLLWMLDHICWVETDLRQWKVIR